MNGIPPHSSPLKSDDSWIGGPFYEVLVPEGASRDIHGLGQEVRASRGPSKTPRYIPITTTPCKHNARTNAAHDHWLTSLDLGRKEKCQRMKRRRRRFT